MTFSSDTWTALPKRALLIFMASCPALLPRTRSSLPPSKLEANGMTLIEKWEGAERPLVFVEHFRASAYETHESLRLPFEDPATQRTHCNWRTRPDYFSDPQVRPRPGDLVFQPELPSLFRNPRFSRLFEDLGGPLLILVSDDLDEFVMETAIDSFLSGHPIIIITDAVPLGSRRADEISAQRSNSLMCLSCFARIVKTNKLLREWAIS